MTASKPDKFLEICRDFVTKKGADVVVFSSRIHAKATLSVRKLCGALREQPTPRKKLILLITTPGGDADEAFRIARTFRRKYEHISLIIHGECKSAGTLIALCADELVMSDSGEIGPLDVQLARSDELAGPPQSGLDLKEALKVLQENIIASFATYMVNIRLGSKLSTRIATDIACKLTTGTYRSIYQQIDPMRLGETQRKIVIANEYGERLASQNVKEDTVADLVAKYPSHGFVIDREQAQDLFHKVRRPDDDELVLLATLPAFVFELQSEKSYIFPLEPMTDGTAHSKADPSSTPPADQPAEPVTAPASIGKGATRTGDAERIAGPQNDSGDED